MKKLLIIFSLILFFSIPNNACTTAVISGKYTANGRPVIWKLRDTEKYENTVRYFTDGKYAYVALFNAEDSEGKEVWGGVNITGFAIMNSASFNLNDNDNSKIKDREGIVMKLALQYCKNLQDFENLLDTLSRPMGLAAHFGVIDAEGGAAFYETDNRKFVKFDANDPKTAPQGYILRTNYAFTGKKGVGYGYIRMQTAEEIFAEAAKKGKLTPRTVIQDFSRCLKHPVLKKDFREIYEKEPEGDYYVNSGDFITRHGSSSALIIEGRNSNEPEVLPVMWTMVGYPNTCMVLPVFPGYSPPKVLQPDASGKSELNTLAMKLKKECYPIETASGYKYLHISKLISGNKKGYIQQLEHAENEVFNKLKIFQRKHKLKKPEAQEVALFYDFLDQYVHDIYAHIQ